MLAPEPAPELESEFTCRLEFIRNPVPFPPDAHYNMPRLQGHDLPTHDPTHSTLTLAITRITLIVNPTPDCCSEAKWSDGYRAYGEASWSRCMHTTEHSGANMSRYYVQIRLLICKLALE